MYQYRERLLTEGNLDQLPPAAVPRIENALAGMETIDEDAEWLRAVEENRRAKKYGPIAGQQADMGIRRGVSGVHGRHPSGRRRRGLRGH